MRTSNFDIKQGLPDNTINCMAQDNRGFVWTGTTNGLAQFDGLFFTLFRYSNTDPTTISNNNVHSLLSIDAGLYVAADFGVDFYSYSDSRFRRCRIIGLRKTCHSFISLTKTKSSVFVVDDDGHLYRSAIGETRFHSVATGQAVHAIASDGDFLFAVMRGSVAVLSADGSRVLSRVSLKPSPSNMYNASYCRNTRRLYVGRGVDEPGQAFDVMGGKLSEAAEPVPASLKMACDYEGGVAFATDGHGVILRRNGMDRLITEENARICGDAIYSLLSDRNGNLWIGSYRKGLTLYSAHRDIFASLSEQAGTLPYNIVAAVASQGDNIYIGMDGGGMGVYSLSGRSLSTYTSHNSQLWGDNIVSMTADRHTVWMAVYNHGLSAFDIATHKITNYPLPLVSKRGDVIWTIVDDGKGNLWVGGRDLFVFNKQTHKFRVVKEFVGSLCQSLCRSGNYIWLGNDNGVYKIDSRTLRTVKHYNMSTPGMSLPNDGVRYVYADSKGRVWVSFRYEAPCCIDEPQGKVLTGLTKHGLGSIIVTGIVESRHGYMVFSSNNGLYIYYPENKAFMRRDLDNSIPMAYNYGACYYDGRRYYFGSVEGLVFADDVPLHHKSLYKDVSLGRLDVAEGRSVNLGSNSEGEVTLGCHENYFTIHYSVPEYGAPRSLHFSYYLKGMEETWNEMTDRREVSYTNVPPGTYEFLVRCTYLTGRWTSASVLRITVLPPWYLTWWAKTLWLLMVIGVVYASFRLYLRMLKMRHRMELAEVEKESQRKLDDAKMTFFASITHELRTPVFLIAAQLEEFIDRKQSVVSVPSAYLMAMHRSAMKINKLISQAIDFRKADKGKLVVKRQEIDVVDFVTNLAGDYDDLLDHKHIAFRTVLPKQPVLLKMDGEKIEMCLNNLISNAYKYTNKGGHVVLTVTDCPDRVVFSVKDDGIGIVPEARTEIFESFFRTSHGQAKSKGDGIGLSFVQTLVELHGGEMHLESEVNEGSDFSFYIPKTAADKAVTAAEADKAVAAAVKDVPAVEAVMEETAVEADADKTEALTTDSLEPTQTVLADEEEPEAVPGTAPLKENPTATHSILLIDDERETVALLERNLINDFRVLKAYDGEEGLRMAAASLPDIIVCDMMMPQLDGLGFLRALREDKKLKHIKVIIFTGQTSEEERIAAYDAGADAFLTKPVSLKLLRVRIDRLIAESDAASLTADLASSKRTYTKEEQKFLLRCREIIDDNMGNPDFNVDFLAEKLAMSHSTLYKKLKQMTGMSLIEFVNDYKIYKAVQAFKEGQTNVVRVAEMCGFGDIKNFRQLFKRKMNMTPKQYVQSL